jgi:hypothetical protein
MMTNPAVTAIVPRQARPRPGVIDISYTATLRAACAAYATAAAHEQAVMTRRATNGRSSSAELVESLSAAVDVLVARIVLYDELIAEGWHPPEHILRDIGKDRALCQLSTGAFDA